MFQVWRRFVMKRFTQKKKKETKKNNMFFIFALFKNYLHCLVDSNHHEYQVQDNHERNDRIFDNENSYHRCRHLVHYGNHRHYRSCCCLNVVLCNHDLYGQVCCSYSRRFGCCPMYNHELNGLVDCIDNNDCLIYRMNHCHNLLGLLWMNCCHDHHTNCHLRMNLIE